MTQEQGRVVTFQRLHIKGVNITTTSKTLRSHQKDSNFSDSTGTHTYTFICIEGKVDV